MSRRATVSLFVLAAAALVLLAGCSANPLLGTWHTTYEVVPARYRDAGVHRINPPGTLTATHNHLTLTRGDSAQHTYRVVRYKRGAGGLVLATVTLPGGGSQVLRFHVYNNRMAMTPATGRDRRGRWHYVRGRMKPIQ